MNVCALDFETANYSRNSACSIGMAKLDGDGSIQTFSSLIRPPSMFFHRTNIRIHGITPQMVMTAPTFNQIYPQMLSFIGNALLVAHNASFDMGVLRASADFYCLSIPYISVGCTLRMSRACFPTLENHRLDTVAHYLGVTFQHHDATQDAEVALKIALYVRDRISAERYMQFFR